MGDIVAPWLGKKRCGWCVDRDVTWWEHFTGQDKFISEIKPWQKAAWKVSNFWTVTLPLWKIGRFAHDRYHVPYDDPVKVKERWCKTVKVGDVVCDCRGRHITVAEILEHEDVLDTEGNRCSLFHCCDAVEDDNSCHEYEVPDEVS